MADRSFLAWPFFDDRHRALAAEIEAWADANAGVGAIDHHDVDGTCRRLVAALGKARLLDLAVPEDRDDRPGILDVRSLCLVRETLARYAGLADFAFAMQGLGTASITLFGTPAQRARYLPGARAGDRIAAFALSEPDAGSDVAAMTTSATTVAGGFRLDGIKTWISNGGIADHYVVFARTGEGPGAKGLSAFVVDADTAGCEIAGRIEVIAPHPLATLAFKNCIVPADRRLGGPGEGFKIAMATLDVFRSTVGAAALGFARRALDEAIGRGKSRRIFGEPLAEQQMIQAKIADMATAIDAAALLVYRAAWVKDIAGTRVTREAAMAKLYATEAAQVVIDEAVQIFGGLGVTKGVKVEELYREIRALRIYEGASEVQKIVIARQAFRAHDHTPADSKIARSAKR